MERFGSVFDAGGSTPWYEWADQLDPLGERFTPALDWAPPEMYHYGAPIRQGNLWEPAPAEGAAWAPPSVALGSQVVEAGIDAWQQRARPEWYRDNYGTTTNPGAVGSPGGEWASVDQWNSQILTAVQAVQEKLGVYVPPNVVKAIMKIESNGNPAEGPAIGLMQLTGSTMGQYDLNRAATDPAYNILAGVEELALRYQDAQAQATAWSTANPNATKKEYGWSNAAVGYFSGHYEPTGADDGYNSDYHYQEMFNTNWSTLANAAGTGGTSAPEGTIAFEAIWGGIDAPVTQEYGMTDYAKEVLASGDDMYNYTDQYTRDGSYVGHMGVDVGLSYGTALYAPVGATVKYAGGTGYYCDNDEGGNGCGPGVGELRLEYANGDVLILGHMSQITVKQGDPVIPGQFVGYSGSEHGGHIHVEYRRYLGPEGTGTPSGYEAADPRLALQGIFTGGFGQSGSGPATAASAAGDWTQFMINASQGLPLTGAVPGAGGFRDWLISKMPGQAPKILPQSQAPASWTFNWTPPTATTPTP